VFSHIFMRVTRFVGGMYDDFTNQLFALARALMPFFEAADQHANEMPTVKDAPRPPQGMRTHCSVDGISDSCTSTGAANGRTSTYSHSGLNHAAHSGHSPRGNTSTARWNHQQELPQAMRTHCSVDGISDSCTSAGAADGRTSTYSHSVLNHARAHSGHSPRGASDSTTAWNHQQVPVHISSDEQQPPSLRHRPPPLATNRHQSPPDATTPPPAATTPPPHVTGSRQPPSATTSRQQSQPLCHHSPPAAISRHQPPSLRHRPPPLATTHRQPPTDATTPPPAAATPPPHVTSSRQPPLSECVRGTVIDVADKVLGQDRVLGQDKVPGQNKVLLAPPQPPTDAATPPPAAATPPPHVTSSRQLPLSESVRETVTDVAENVPGQDRIRGAPRAAEEAQLIDNKTRYPRMDASVGEWNNTRTYPGSMDDFGTAGAGVVKAER
jgi:hypothetical protein